jgi:glycosyltransferase involved in cell wall biosynthesis
VAGKVDVLKTPQPTNIHTKDFTVMKQKASEKKTKILFIMSFPPPFHGANLSNQMVWESNVQNEFECQLLDLSDRRDLNNLGRFEFTNVYLALKHLAQIAKVLLTMKPDLVYMLISQNKWAVVRDNSIVLLVKSLSKAKTIIHLRGAFFKYFYDNTSARMKKFVDLTMKKVDAVIVLGNNQRFNFDQWTNNIFVVPNGTDLLLDFNYEKKIALKKDAVITITYMSNFFKSKGILEVLESVSEVVKKFPDKKIEYKIAGAWGLDPILGISAETIKVEADRILGNNDTARHVEFLGVITGDVKLDLLRKTDIFLLPTSYDGHPRAIIEAMAACCPVISTPVGAIPETVMDGETGYIIQPHITALLTEKIVTLIGDANLREKLSKGSRKRYEECYTKEQFINGMIKTFHTIAAQ